MKVTNISFPHPVLGINNDVTGQYTGTLNVKPEKEFISLTIVHEIFNPEYANLIKNGDANFCVEVHCMKTFYRNSFLTSEMQQTIRISTFDLMDLVEVEYAVVAVRDLKNFSLRGWHSDYKGNQFEIRKGDVLGYGGKA